jgi:hypothetical protein
MFVSASTFLGLLFLELLAADEEGDAKESCLGERNG